MARSTISDKRPLKWWTNIHQTKFKMSMILGLRSASWTTPLRMARSRSCRKETVHLHLTLHKSCATIFSLIRWPSFAAVRTYLIWRLLMHSLQFRSCQIRMGLMLHLLSLLQCCQLSSSLRRISTWLVRTCTQWTYLELSSLASRDQVDLSSKPSSKRKRLSNSTEFRKEWRWLKSPLVRQSSISTTIYMSKVPIWVGFCATSSSRKWRKVWTNRERRTWVWTNFSLSSRRLKKPRLPPEKKGRIGLAKIDFYSTRLCVLQLI